MANKTNDQTNGTETQNPPKTEEIKLPAYFDVSKAAGIVGAEKAQSFFDEVAFIATGNISQHKNPGISFKALEIAASDVNNSQIDLAQDTLKRVKALFAEAQAEAQKANK